MVICPLICNLITCLNINKLLNKIVNEKVCCKSVYHFCVHKEELYLPFSQLQQRQNKKF